MPNFAIVLMTRLGMTEKMIFLNKKKRLKNHLKNMLNFIPYIVGYMCSGSNSITIPIEKVMDEQNIYYMIPPDE